MFTVTGTENLSVSVSQPIPNTAPPNLWTIGPFASHEQAIIRNPPFGISAANVPAVCQLTRMSPLSLSISFLESEVLGRSSTYQYISIILAATTLIKNYCESQWPWDLELCFMLPDANGLAVDKYNISIWTRAHMYTYFLLNDVKQYCYFLFEKVTHSSLNHEFCKR